MNSKTIPYLPLFNTKSRQIFVTQPRNTGGGVLSFMLSLDSRTASLNFKKFSLDQKLEDWHRFINRRLGNAHVYGFNNYNQPIYYKHIENADDCLQYVHKHHFYELLDDKLDSSFLKSMPDKQSVGIYLTEDCVLRLKQIRPNTPQVDYYQLWIYANQSRLMKDFFDINCRHVLPFKDMLDTKKLLDHLAYCGEIFDLDTNPDVYRQVVSSWHECIT